MNAMQLPNIRSKPGNPPSRIRNKAISLQIYNIIEKRRETCSLSHYHWEVSGLFLMRSEWYWATEWPESFGWSITECVVLFPIVFLGRFGRELEKWHNSNRKGKKKSTLGALCLFWHLRAAAVILYLLSVVAECMRAMSCTLTNRNEDMN